QSIDRAIENQGVLKWQRYVLCTNVDLTGSQEQKLREYLPFIEFLTKTYWINLCSKFSQSVSHRFRFLSEEVSRTPIWNVPYHHTPFFTGREDIIAQLYHSLHVNQVAAIPQSQALFGVGGIGKTQVDVY